ncbi:MAG: thiamine pyrophosphate-dependent enzyme [Candidatus Diapherotrites archaeon]
MINLSTPTKPTWCPGCWNFQILAGVKNYLNKKIKSEKDREKYAIVTGIGCHAKIFDYINLNGINTLHGRVLPTILGIKVGKPDLNLIGFSGDGDAYAEGMEHLIHAARYNANIKYFVHNNQVFALTVGQPTPTTETGFKDRTTPQGVKIPPINPIKLMLASGATFVARVYADVKQIEKVLDDAFKHKGFAFIEVIQPCLIFHPNKDYKKYTYFLEDKKHDKENFEQAMKRAQEFNYDKIDKNTKIPLGIFYQEKRKTFEENIKR